MANNIETGKDSVFRSGMRTLLKSFFGVVGLFLAFVICSIFYSIISPPPLIEENTTLTVLPDAQGNRKINSFQSPAVLQINIHGVIGEAKKGVTAEDIESILLDSREGLLESNRVKAILLHFDTPGGGVTDSDNIYQMIKDYKKKFQVPVYGYIDGLCASGGIYIASAADKLFAGPSSVIGSVGVLMGPFFNVSETLTKVGIQAKTLTQGIDKDMFNPTRPWKEGEDASVKAIMGYLYERFVDIVCEARPQLSKDKLIHEYGAQVFDCKTAQKFGYIDVAMSSRNEALSALLEAAHIDASTPYQVVELSHKQGILSLLAEGKFDLLQGKVEHSIDFHQPKIKDRFAYLLMP